MWQKRKLFRAALIMSYTNNNRTEPRQGQNSHSVTSYDNDLDRSIEPQTAVDRRRQAAVCGSQRGVQRSQRPMPAPEAVAS